MHYLRAFCLPRCPAKLVFFHFLSFSLCPQKLMCARTKKESTSSISKLKANPNTQKMAPMHARPLAHTIACGSSFPQNSPPPFLCFRHHHPRNPVCPVGAVLAFRVWGPACACPLSLSLSLFLSRNPTTFANTHNIFACGRRASCVCVCVNVRARAYMHGRRVLLSRQR